MDVLTVLFILRTQITKLVREDWIFLGWPTYGHRRMSDGVHTCSILIADFDHCGEHQSIESNAKCQHDSRLSIIGAIWQPHRRDLLTSIAIIAAVLVLRFLINHQSHRIHKRLDLLFLKMFWKEGEGKKKKYFFQLDLSSSVRVVGPH